MSDLDDGSVSWERYNAVKRERDEARSRVTELEAEAEQLRDALELATAANEGGNELLAEVRSRLSSVEAERDRLLLATDGLVAQLANARKEWSTAQAGWMNEITTRQVAERERDTCSDRLGVVEGLLSEMELTETIDNTGDAEDTPCEPWEMCLQCGEPREDCDAEGKCLGARVRAFLVPVSPTSEGSKP